MPDETWYGDDGEPGGRLVPLYMLVNGRTTPRNTSLNLATQVTALPVDTSALEPEYREIIACCSGWISVAELAAYLNKQLTVVKLLVDVLLERGFLALGDPAERTVADYRLLETILDRLQRL
ncbi:DUF742 domain-containing protein [Catenuloplanes indicus]|uniref:DUF742 domain-containing protein n=1 Tax=Catenuloplanes indicus TaxID=137267 RepID=A0AAE4AX48_9ACTN|nr:DUF742 domain-containing protein [Catenuloplanes indicus]MDQ0365386.1 hypothetical protein [Catenuloplanes indicus]